ncbi:hypothetical protein PpBr36_04504 [Pyricularia pennisetigena]|uniref:hypothetical protein n=1 Tax=Pyricularia pennisetigena TaxID=1578925 RepID=UPI00115147A9|nr:hypothetical protein PpBr36_04504 [Pyricularia pennisetigena]TLS26186.1 hypothetical protein PpBr36_04504 [Pyricularia pennisetigena]
MSSHKPSAADTSSGDPEPQNSQQDALGSESSYPLNMPSYSNMPSSSPQGSRKHSSSSKSKQKSDDWSQVTDPEERRRIQNRIAQRKFRTKAREQKEKSDRDSRNVEYAGSSYQVPGADDLGLTESDVAPSGLPWGGVNMHYVVGRGHDDAGSGGRGGASAAAHQRGGSTMGTYTYGSDPQYLSPTYPDMSSYAYTTSGSWEGNDDNAEGEDPLYYESTPYYYDYQGSSSR